MAATVRSDAVHEGFFNYMVNTGSARFVRSLRRSAPALNAQWISGRMAQRCCRNTDRAFSMQHSQSFPFYSIACTFIF